MAVTRAQRRMAGGGVAGAHAFAVEDPPDADDSGADDDARDGDDKLVLLPGDASALALLTLLYTLQGVPMGLASTLTFLLQDKGVSYAAQGTTAWRRVCRLHRRAERCRLPALSTGVFSFVSWPFSLKILWAPLVDSLYFPALGQRRTWLIPVQVCWVAKPSEMCTAPVVPLLTPSSRVCRRWWAPCCW